MLDWVLPIVVAPFACVLVFWVALIVLAIKGFLFHRNWKAENQLNAEQSPIPAELPPEETPPGIGLGWAICFWFFFWPMLLAQIFNDWLSARKQSKD